MNSAEPPQLQIPLWPQLQLWWLRPATRRAVTAAFRGPAVVPYAAPCGQPKYFVIHSFDFIGISLSNSLIDNFFYTLAHRGQSAGACAPRFSMGGAARRSPIGRHALFHPYNNRILFLPNESRALTPSHWRLRYDFSSLGAAKEQPGGVAARAEFASVVQERLGWTGR